MPAISLDGYEERHIAFIDILGFSSFIHTIENNQKIKDVYGKILSTLRFMDEETVESHYQADLPVYTEENGRVIERELEDPRMLYVSDCMIISTEATFDGFKALCNKVTKVATDLAWYGFFIRGAITTGNLYHHDRMLFGTAYMNAYKMEESDAKVPRVIIDQKTVQFLGGYPTKFPMCPPTIEKAKDGWYYLRYLPWYYYPPYCSTWSDYLLRIKDHIVDNIVKHKGTSQDDKYEWLRDEFNFCVSFYRDKIDPVVTVIQ